MRCGGEEKACRSPSSSLCVSSSAIWHAILDNFRPVSVWSTDLVIYYIITNGAFGEAWTQYSWLQFSGMMVREQQRGTRCGVPAGPPPRGNFRAK